MTRALGRQRDLAGRHAVPHRWQPGDVLLLCSDGLTTMVPDDDIAAHPAARRTATSRSGREALVAAANARGGEDNITVLL